MRVTIEYFDKDDAIQAMNAGSWESVLWEVDQHLRAMVRHPVGGEQFEFADNLRAKIAGEMEDKGVRWSL